MKRNDLIGVWCAETIYHKYTFDETCPERGQCAVTALLVNDLLGGEIVYNKKLNHYFNTVNGNVIDLTKGQFDIESISINEIVDRKKLCNGHTKKRYLILKERYLN